MTDVNVTIGASVDNLVRGVNQAHAAVNNFANGAKAAMSQVTAPFEKFQSLLLSIASIAAGGYLFHDIISSTVEMASEVGKLQKVMGLNLEEANNLAATLKLLGINTDEYTSMAIRLDRQIRTNNVSLQDMGFTAKDLDLGQKGVMDKAIAKLLEYKEGADRNTASMVLFGRNVDEVFKLLRLGIPGVADRAKELHEALGLAVTQDDKKRALEYKIAMSELGMAFDGIKKAIGEAVLPYLTKFSQWFTDKAPALITGMKETVKTVVGFAFDLAAGIANFGVTVMEGLFNMFVIAQYLRTKLGWISEDQAQSSIDRMEVALDKLTKLRDQALGGLESVRTSVLGGGGPTSDKPLEPGKGTKTFTPIDQNAIKAQMDIIQTQMKLADAAYKATEDRLSTQVKIYAITQTEETSALLQALTVRHDAEIAGVNKELAIRGISRAEYQKFLDEKKLLNQQYADEYQKLLNKQLVDQAQAWNSALGSIQSAWDGQLKGLLARTTSWAQAMKNIAGDLIMKMISEFEKLAIVNPLTKMLSTFTPPAEFVTGILKMIMASVGQVFSGVAGFLAPILGPAAPAAAAGVAAGVEGTAKGLASLDVGSWRVPADMTARIHRDEMVVPAGMAESIRSGGGGSFGGHTVNIHISAMDAGGFHGALKGGLGDAITRHVSRALQSNPSMRPGYTR